MSFDVRGRPFDSWGGLWFFCEKKIVQQIFENKLFVQLLVGKK